MSKQTSLGDTLQAMPRTWLFAILFIVSSVPLFFPSSPPNTPASPADDLYLHVMSLPEGSTILLASDWTNSTRGESRGEFEALLKIMVDRHLKAAIYTTADPQAPRVSRDTIEQFNKLQRAKNKPTFDNWKDWVSLGFYPSAEGQLLSIATNLKRAFAGRSEINPATGRLEDVFKSPVLEKITKLEDCPLAITITASKTSDLTVERFGSKVPMAFMVTGVMGPETQVYYASGQIVGLSNGLKGVFDLETLMAKGLNTPDADSVKSAKITGTAPKLDDPDVKGKGTLYYPTLNFALLLLIIMVVVGNVGMFLSKKNGKAA